jgi:hypothetical protein
MKAELGTSSVHLRHLINFLKARKGLIKARAAYRKDPKTQGVNIKLPSVKELWAKDLVWVLPSDDTQPGVVAGIEPFTYTSVNGRPHPLDTVWYSDRAVRVNTAALLDVCEKMVPHVKADPRYDVQLRLDGFGSLCVMHKEAELRVYADTQDEGWLPDIVKFHTCHVLPVATLALDEMQKLRPVAATDTTRGNLNGVHYNHKLHRLEASDGHRAHIIHLTRGLSDGTEADRNFTVDMEILDFAKALKVSDAYFQTTDRRGDFVLLGRHTWVQQRPADTFPLLANIIDSYRLTRSASWIAPRKALAAAVTVAKGQREHTHGAVVIAASSRTATVWAHKQDAKEYVDLLLHCGDPIKRFGMHPTYMLDAFKLLGCMDIYVNVEDEYSPVYFTAGDFGRTILCVVMPIRL